jgi:hypothetical protein
MAVMRTVLAAAFLALACPVLLAKPLYKIVDRQGKVSYVDQVPKNFDGEVTEIVIDPAPATKDAPRAAPEGRAVRDINAERRTARATLGAALERARAKVEAARKALADGVDPEEGEYQTIQQRIDASGAKPDAPGPRSNCRRVAGADGQSSWNCPTIVPGEKYRERRKALEEDLRAAEAELHAAEQAYRRGTD